MLRIFGQELGFKSIVAGSALSIYVLSLLILKRIQRGPSRTYSTSLEGKVVIITGCSAGIGKETARDLARRGATVVFACRDKLKTINVMEEIKKDTKSSKLVFIQLDLSDYNSVYSFCKIFREQFDRLDILINNAGIANTKVQNDGHDFLFKTNHMGHFLLTQQLIDLVVKTKFSRIINVSSNAHFFVREKVNWADAYNGKVEKFFLPYAISKYANVLFTQGLQQRLDAKNIQTKVVSLHPGAVNTEIFGKGGSILQKIFKYTILQLFRFAMLNEQEGAWTTLYTALQPFEQLSPAGYYLKNSLGSVSKQVQQFDQADELWNFSEKELNVKFVI